MTDPAAAARFAAAILAPDLSDEVEARSTQRSWPSTSASTTPVLRRR